MAVRVVRRRDRLASLVKNENHVWLPDALPRNGRFLRVIDGGARIVECTPRAKRRAPRALPRFLCASAADNQEACRLQAYDGKLSLIRSFPSKVGVRRRLRRTACGMLLGTHGTGMCDGAQRNRAHSRRKVGGVRQRYGRGPQTHPLCVPRAALAVDSGFM